MTKRRKPPRPAQPADSGGVFNDVHLSWKGVKFVIPSDKVMGAISRIEEHITLKELLDMMSGGSPKIATLSRAYASVLRYAGCMVGDEDVYLGMFSSAEKEQQISLAFSALNGLLSMMIPPKAMQEMQHRVTTSGESKGQTSSEDAASLSQQPSKQPMPGG